MLDTALYQIRYSFSVAFGRRPRVSDVRSLVEHALATRQRLGSIENPESLVPELEPDVAAAMLQRRIRNAAQNAQSAPFYSELFRRQGIEPGRLVLDAFTLIPTTTRADYSAVPGAFQVRDAKPAVVALTTGTTGTPRRVWFSEYEIDLAAAVGALNAALAGTLGPDSAVQINISSRAIVPLMTAIRSCVLLGATVAPLGIVDPEVALGNLCGDTAAGGSRRPTLWMTYPSYLGEVITIAEQRDLTPDDFALDTIICGGEYLSNGLESRAAKLFGVTPDGGYGTTELYPFAARECSARHLHFNREQGLVEVLSTTSDAPSRRGELGELVATPFPPYRETTPLIRYRTGDLAYSLDGEDLSCELSALPATSQVADRLNRGGPRSPSASQLLESLEGLPDVPLPIRCGLAFRNGETVAQVLAQPGFSPHDGARTALGRIGVTDLVFVDRVEELAHPIHRRSDLREASYRRTYGGSPT